MSDSERFEKGAEVMQKLLGRVPEEGGMQEDFGQITVKISSVTSGRGRI